MAGKKGIKPSKETIMKRKWFYFNKAKIHIGEKFGKLEIVAVVNRKRNSGDYRNKFLCQCKCGCTTEVDYSDLTSGRVVSCGCYQHEQLSKACSKLTFFDDVHKYKWYFIKNNIKIKCRSSYEVMFANYLIDSNIEFEYEPQIFKLENGKRYTPDFYLNNSDQWIELKGNFGFNVAQLKSIEMFSSNHNLKVMYWFDIREFCHLKLKYWGSYMKRAKKSNIKIEDYFAMKKYL